ncbi:hypothetical protein I3843_12G082000 [Carya illinoinensis]|nr:NAD(P)H-quinone oxidoreductase subunit S, chloroplastic [Carya illinoinensis]KAG2677043.1 hypothetical protein I3760_12G079900 [Carya illinoinensis]KAG6684805.1 hypothetical protein I3842_12G081100 [Carya illinoinensis]KAG7952892.1 hypothetical protein I3843_12G082000 [Carya illinoinensis]
MAPSIIPLSIPCSPLKSHFLGGNRFSHHHLHKPYFTIHKQPSTQHLTTCAKFDLFQIMGGRGLCNGEQGLQQELKRNIEEQASAAAPAAKHEKSGNIDAISIMDHSVPENAFEKELMGLTGGFPGGEKGLKTFIERNPLSMPGMISTVQKGPPLKNPKSDVLEPVFEKKDSQ